MKRLIILVLFVLPTLSYCQDSDINLYRLAMIEIKTSDIFKKFSDGEQVNFQVIPEVIPMYKLGFIFREELQEQTGIDYRVSKDTAGVSKNLDLLQLSEKRKSELKIFFSEIVSDSFMAEVAYGLKKQKDWKSVTMFGQSLIFLFKIVDDKVIIIESTELANN